MAKNALMLGSLRIVLLVLCVGMVLSQAKANAENWTRFRGPNGSGLAAETTFPATWTEEDYLWKIQLPGVGDSSPVGWGNRLFVSSSNVDTGKVWLQCLAADTGKQLWRSEFVGQDYRMHRSNSLASTTPTVDDERVYLSWASGGKMHLVALTHAGDEVWREELGDFVGNHGFASSPVVVEGIVCVQIDEADAACLAGYDAQSGEILWRAERPAGKATYASPCFVTYESKLAVISNSFSSGMQVIDVQTGKVLWEQSEAFPQRCVSSPVVAGNLVLGTCGSGGGGKLLSSIDLGSHEQAILTKHVPYVPTPLVIGESLFLWHDQGRVSLVDLSEGAPQKNSWTKRVGGNFFGSPILAGDKIYCMSQDGQAIVLAAGAEFELLGETDLGEPTNATPAVHAGRMYLRTASGLACLPAESE